MAFASAINATLPVDNVLAVKADMRANFLAAKNELNLAFSLAKSAKGYFGAKGDNVSDDTAALQDAFNSGISFILDNGVYKTSAALTSVAGNGAVCFGRGARASIIKPAGNFNVLSYTGGGDACGIMNVGFDGSSMTGGIGLVLDNTNRFICEDVRLDIMWNTTYVRKCNCVWFNRVYGGGARGTCTFNLVGDNSNRSDMIGFRDVFFAGDPAVRPIGLSVDGNVNTVIGDNIGLITMGIGHQVINTAGGALPYFTWLSKLQIDYPSMYAMDIQQGQFHLYEAMYAHGSSVASNLYAGVRVGASASYIQFNGGKNSAPGRECFDIAGKHVEINDVQSTGASLGTGKKYLHDTIVVRSGGNVDINGGVAGSGFDGTVQSRFGIFVIAGGEAHINQLDLTGNGLGAWMSQTSLFSATGCRGANLSVVGNMAMGTDIGYGAYGLATISAGGVASIAPAATHTGHNFWTVPTVTVLGDGTGATATPIMTGDKVTGYTVTAPGTGYTYAYARVNPVQGQIVSPFYPALADVALQYLAQGAGYIALGNAVTPLALAISDLKAQLTVPIGFPSYVRTALPSVTTYIDGLIYVSNATGGASVAYSNGTNWISLRTAAAV